MKIEERKITVGELTSGYSDDGKTAQGVTKEN